MIKTLYTLVLILVANWLLSSLVLSFDLDPESLNYFLARNLQKALLLGVCLYVVLRSKFRPKLLSNSIWAIPLSLILIALAYNQVDSASGAQKIFVPIGTHLAFLFGCILVGFFEEFLFRVYVFCEFWGRKSTNSLGLKSLLKTVFLTSVLFGIAHATNLFRTGYSAEGVINQVLLAITLGVLFQALFIRFNNVVLIAVLHGLVNYLGSYRSALFGLTVDPSPFILTDFLIGLAIIFAILLFVVTPISIMLIKPKLD